MIQWLTSWMSARQTSWVLLIRTSGWYRAKLRTMFIPAIFFSLHKHVEQYVHLLTTGFLSSSFLLLWFKRDTADTVALIWQTACDVLYLKKVRVNPSLGFWVNPKSTCTGWSLDGVSPVVWGEQSEALSETQLRFRERPQVCLILALFSRSLWNQLIWKTKNIIKLHQETYDRVTERYIST